MTAVNSQAPSNLQLAERREDGGTVALAGSSFEVPKNFVASHRPTLAREELLDPDSELWLLQLPESRELSLQHLSGVQWPPKEGPETATAARDLGHFALENGTQYTWRADWLPAGTLWAALPEYEGHSSAVKRITRAASCLRNREPMPEVQLLRDGTDGAEQRAIKEVPHVTAGSGTEMIAEGFEGDGALALVPALRTPEKKSKRKKDPNTHQQPGIAETSAPAHASGVDNSVDSAPTTEPSKKKTKKDNNKHDKGSEEQPKTRRLQEAAQVVAPDASLAVAHQTTASAKKPKRKLEAEEPLQHPEVVIVQGASNTPGSERGGAWPVAPAAVANGSSKTRKKAHSEGEVEQQLQKADTISGLEIENTLALVPASTALQKKGGKKVEQGLSKPQPKLMDLQGARKKSRK